MADIILSNICKRFGEKTLFENFSLKIERGEFLSIMGESGAGKTTLLNMMGLLDRPDSGTVVLCGQKNPAFSSRTAVNLRRRHISYLFQNYGLIDTETVENNMRIATHFKSISKKKERRLIADALEQVGLQGYEKRKVYTLSGGEQQRVALAKVIAKSPQIIFADEPTGNLDSHTSEEVMELMQQVVRQQKKTLVMVTHDNHLATYADRVFHISDGKIIKIEDHRSGTEHTEDRDKAISGNMNPQDTEYLKR